MWRKFQSSVSYKIRGCFVVVLVGWFLRGRRRCPHRSTITSDWRGCRSMAGKRSKTTFPFCFEKRKEAHLPDFGCSVDSPARNPLFYSAWEIRKTSGTPKRDGWQRVLNLERRRSLERGFFSEESAVGGGLSFLLEV